VSGGPIDMSGNDDPRGWGTGADCGGGCEMCDGVGCTDRGPLGGAAEGEHGGHGAQVPEGLGLGQVVRVRTRGPVGDPHGPAATTRARRGGKTPWRAGGRGPPGSTWRRGMVMAGAVSPSGDAYPPLRPPSCTPHRT